MKKKKFQLLYLYVDNDGVARQSDSAPTQTDLSCVASQILHVYRWYVDAYEELILDVNGNNFSWSKIDLAELCYDASDEIGQYHSIA